MQRLNWLLSRLIPAKWGDFLCALFDEWVQKDVGNFFIQIFDATLLQLGWCATGRLFDGKDLWSCRSDEFNGDVYACDHFVFPAYKLGNIRTQTLTEMMYSPKQLQFGADKYEKLPQVCKQCEFLFACNGECPKPFSCIQPTW